MNPCFNTFPQFITSDGCTILGDGVVIGDQNKVIGFIDPIHLEQMFMEQMFFEQMNMQMLAAAMVMEQQMQMQFNSLPDPTYNHSSYLTEEQQCSHTLYSSDVFQLDESGSQLEMEDWDILDANHPGVKFAEMLLDC